MQKLKCLFIEDSHVDVEILDWELKKRGVFLEYTVVETEAELKLALLDNDFDLIVTDHNMPCMNSLTALIKCRELAPLVPLVVSSIYISDNVIAALKANNVNAIIEKYNFDALYQYMQMILSGKTS